MTLRQLDAMARGRCEMEGEVAAHLLSWMAIAVWFPRELPKELNPFKGPKPDSEALRAYKAKLAEMKLAAMKIVNAGKT